MSSTNILVALKNILQYGMRTIPPVMDHESNNRINNQGNLLEYFIKDAFCGESIKYESSKKKRTIYEKKFSYLGNSNNPPDFIIRGGPAVEVKKLSSKSPSALALNSSYPKSYLYHNDPRISDACRICENDLDGWEKKDIIYAIGNITKKNELFSLWFIYGDCFCADKDTYERITNTIREGVESIKGVKFASTNELGRVNNVDPLGITYLRIRGMWHIDHPSRQFKHLISDANKQDTNIYLLMKKDTFNSLPSKEILDPFINQGNLKIKSVEITDPNDANKKIPAIFIHAVLR